MLRVITNGDDFGLCEGVCAGIVNAIETGGLTATTAMLCVPGAVDRLSRWAPRIRGRIGLHLQLTAGTPVLPASRIRSLVTEDGRFPADYAEWSNSRKPPATEEILAEWRAQIEAALGLGIEPTHIDSHDHIHNLAEAFPAYVEIARQHRIPARSTTPATTEKLRAAGVICAWKTVLTWYSKFPSIARLVSLLEEAACDCPESGFLEVMCHPGLVDEDLRSSSIYVEQRARELAILCDPALPGALGAKSFFLVMPSNVTAMHWGLGEKQKN